MAKATSAAATCIRRKEVCLEVVSQVFHLPPSCVAVAIARLTLSETRSWSALTKVVGFQTPLAERERLLDLIVLGLMIGGGWIANL